MRSQIYTRINMFFALYENNGRLKLDEYSNKLDVK